MPWSSRPALAAASLLVLCLSPRGAAAAERLLQEEAQERSPAVQRLPLPLDREAMRSCGDSRWRKWYAGLVRQMQEGELPPRYLVNTHFHTGLSDRLVDTMSAFWTAVASERALVIAPYPGTHGFEVAYEWASFNATAAHNYTGWEDGDLRSERKWNMWDTSLENQNEHMLWYTWKGQTVDFFEQHRFRDMFHEFGIHAATAFGCAMNYLLKPNEAVRSMFADQFSIMERKDILKIGIQVRLGDDHIARQEEVDTLKDVVQRTLRYFECAEQLEARYKEDYSAVVWFLVTDSKTLRHWALSKYGDSGDGKLITSIHTKLEHSSRGGSFDTFTYGEKSNYKQDRASVAGFQASAGENWLFGLADYHVISQWSGFGRTAAFRSLRSNTIYTLETDDDTDANCSVPWGFTRPYDAAHQWSRI